MPGGRLTQQERQQIALGLADGLAYAEIARRLDRPTSTITREVMRNGGPTAYRAEMAHRATERRAHRRRRTTPRGAGTRAGSRARRRSRTRVRRDVHDRHDGLGHAHDDGPGDGLPHPHRQRQPHRVELAQRLQVSPASISKAITFLDSQGMVRREQGERRRERYIVDDDVWYQSMMASARAIAQVVEVARQGVGVLGTGTPAAARLENVARFLDFVSENTRRAAEQAREVLHTKHPTPADGAAEPGS